MQLLAGLPRDGDKVFSLSNQAMSDLRNFRVASKPVLAAATVAAA